MHRTEVRGRGVVRWTNTGRHAERVPGEQRVKSLRRMGPQREQNSRAVAVGAAMQLYHHRHLNRHTMLLLGNEMNKHAGYTRQLCD